MEYDVFISYSRKDKVSAEQLCAELDKAGISYWIDREIHSSANFLTEISQRIIACKVVIFIASDSSAKSIWTQKEILFAIKHDKTIIPYRINKFSFDSNNELDFVFTNVQWVDDITEVVADVNSLCYNAEKATNRINIPVTTKRYFKPLLFVCILISILGFFLSLLKPFNDAHSGETHIEDICDPKQTIINKFEAENESPISERLDIVDLLNTFMVNENIYSKTSWSAFGEYIKLNQLIPLSDGIEWVNNNDGICEDEQLDEKLEFISKLSYNGDNLVSDIFGQAQVQRIHLYGSRTGASILIIDVKDPFLDRVRCNKNIIYDAGFWNYSSINRRGSANYHYTIFKNDNTHWLISAVLNLGGDGYYYRWFISKEKELLDDFVMHFNNDEIIGHYLKMALSINGDDYPRRYGWENATVFDRPELKGDIETLVVEHKETGQHCKDFYKFNNRGDVISHTSHNQTGAIDYTTEFKYDYPNNFVRELFHDKDGITEYESHYIDTESFLLSNLLSEYKYDDKGTITEEIKKYDYIQTHHFYKYDMSGNIISEVIKQVDQPTITIEYKYDEKGNVIQLNRTPGRFSDSSLTTYTYTYR